MDIKSFIILLFIFFNSLIISYWTEIFFSPLVSICSLYYISSKIQIKGDLQARPITNLLFMSIGICLALLIGATCSFIVLIQFILIANRNRKYFIHTFLFFIFILSILSIAPLQLPLFYGYIEKMTYTRTYELIQEIFLFITISLVIYFVIDFMTYKFIEKKILSKDEKITLTGKINFIWLFGILILCGFLNEKFIPIIKQYPYLRFIREVAMVLLMILSKFSSERIFEEKENNNLDSTKQVVYLLIGIFVSVTNDILNTIECFKF